MGLFDESGLRELVRGEVADVIVDLVLPAVASRDVPELLSIGRVQRRLDCSWGLVDRLIKDGELDAVRVGRDRRVTAASLAAFVERHREQPSKSARGRRLKVAS